MLMGWCSGHNHVQDKLSSGEERKFLALRARRHQDETVHWDSQGFFYYPLRGTLDPEHVCQFDLLSTSSKSDLFPWD